MASQRTQGRILRQTDPQTRRPHPRDRSDVDTNSQPNGSRTIVAAVASIPHTHTPQDTDASRPHCCIIPIADVRHVRSELFQNHLAFDTSVAINSIPRVQSIDISFQLCVRYSSASYERHAIINEQLVTSRHKHNNISQNQLKCDDNDPTRAGRGYYAPNR